MLFKTEQEGFWAGKFGDEYIGRNSDKKIIASNISLFNKILRKAENVKTIIEYGANIGLNLLAIEQLLIDVKLSAVEVNEKAVTELNKIDKIKVYHDSILNFKIDYERDFVFTKGVLIHINPDFLPSVYDLLYRSTKKYICLIEYYNPTPMSMCYRGHVDKLFKRDFAGEMLNIFQDLNLVDYGFCYHRDNNFSQEDVNWFLLEKK